MKINTGILSKTAGVSAIYLALTLVFTYPLVLKFNSFFIGGAEDGSVSFWGMWWFKYSLMDLGESPLWTNYLFYPDGISLVFHSLPKLLCALSIPCQYIFGLTATYNLIVLFTFVATGLATYWLAYHFLGQHIPAAVAGAFFMLSPYRTGQISHLTLLSTILLPVFILLLFKGWEALEDERGRRWTYFALAGAALGLTAYDTEYYAVFLLIFTYIFIFYCFLTRGRDEGLRLWYRLVGGSLIILAIAALLYSPLLIASLVEVGRHGSYTSSKAIPPSLYASDPISILIPGKQSAYLGEYFKDFQFSSSFAEPGYLGWTAIALAILAIAAYRRLREVWLWVAVALVFIVLSLGPEPFHRYQSLPETVRELPGLFGFFRALPVLDGIRVPSRFICMAALAVSLLAGYGVSSLIKILKRRPMHRVLVPALIVAIGLAAFLEYRPVIDLTSMDVPGSYVSIRDSNAQGTVLTIPLGWQTGYTTFGDEHSWTQLTQTVHERPMPGGMVARAPEGLLEREAARPVLSFLSDPTGRQPSRADKEPADIDGFFSRYDVRFIVCQKAIPDVYFNGRLYQSFEVMTPQELEKIDAYVTEYLGMEKIEETDEVVVYQRT